MACEMVKDSGEGIFQGLLLAPVYVYDNNTYRKHNDFIRYGLSCQAPHQAGLYSSLLL